MEYEICKGSVKNGKPTWSAIAWTDVESCAKKILAALALAYGGKYAVLVGGKVILEES